MSKVKSLTQEELKDWLHYDPRSGLFHWLKTGLRIQLFRRPGNLTKQGYRRIGIGNYVYQEHQLAYLYMTGEWPKQDIDHINGVKDDNRWENLRAVSRMENLHNRGNVSGFKKNGKRFSASLQVNKKTIYLGTFDTQEIAREEYLKAKRKYFPGTRYG